MNWIDKKYRDNLKDEKFSNAARQKGWEKVQPMLDEEFPVTAGAASGGARYWKFGLIAVAAVGLIVSGIIWLTPSESDSKELGYYEPRDPASIDQNIDAGEVNETDHAAWKELEEKPEVNKTTENKSSSVPEQKDIVADYGESTSQSAGELGSETSREITASSESIASENGGEESQGLSDQRNAPSDRPQEKIALEPKNSSSHQVDLTKETDRNKLAAISNETELPRLQSPEAGEEDDEPQVNIAGKDIQEETTSEDQVKLELTEQETEAIATIDADQKAKSEVTPSGEISGGGEVPGSEEQRDQTSENSIAEQPAKPEMADAENEVDEEEVLDDEPETTEESSKSRQSKRDNWHLSFPAIAEVENSSSEEEILPSLSGRRFSVAIWGGYTYTDKFLEADNLGYQNKREAEEEAIWTTPTGIEFDYYLDRKWTFSTGLSWSEYGEELSYDITRTDSVYFDGRYDSPKSYSNIIALDSVRIIDSINQGHWNYNLVYQYEDSTVQANNGRTSITYVEIPALIGYRMGSGWARPWVKTGVSLGIPIRQDFRYLNNTADDIQPVANATTSVAPLQWSYLLNLGLDCKISRHWSIRLNGMSSLHLNSILEDKAVKQRYYRLGGRVGVAYHF